MPRQRLILLVLLSAANAANAGTAYKCVDTHGNVAYQDRPCADGAHETQLSVDTSSTPKDSADVTPADPPAPSPIVTVTPVPVPPARPAKPLPPLWICTRPEDGKQYVSNSGVVQSRRVPLGVLGVPGNSLAKTYGPGGVGVSAPELNKTPVATSGNTSPGAVLAGQYTEVQDDCVQATPSQTCDYLRTESDRIHEKLRRAFKDVRAELEPRANELEDQLNSCP